MNCFHCAREITVTDRVGFRDECRQCGRPLHVCLNCGFHDSAYNNQCRETQAERVVDKQRANFCEYFRPRTAPAARPLSPGATPRATLDTLFKKKK